MASLVGSLVGVGKVEICLSERLGRIYGGSRWLESRMLASEIRVRVRWRSGEVVVRVVVLGCRLLVEWMWWEGCCCRFCGVGICNR